MPGVAWATGGCTGLGLFGVCLWHGHGHRHGHGPVCHSTCCQVRYAKIQIHLDTQRLGGTDTARQCTLCDSRLPCGSHFQFVLLLRLFSNCLFNVLVFARFCFLSLSLSFCVPASLHRSTNVCVLGACCGKGWLCGSTICQAKPQYLNFGPAQKTDNQIS